MRSTAFALLLLASSASARDFVTGQVLAPGGVGLPGCNLDFFDAATGQEELNVFNDGTGPGGFFFTTVPPGTYNVLIWAPSALAILPGWVNGVVVSGVTNMGVTQLDPGVFLSGTVTHSGGIPVAGVNIDVEVSATGQDIPLHADQTNLLGAFQFVVPATEVDVKFKPSIALSPLLAPRRIRDLSVCVNTNLGAVPLSAGFVLDAFAFAGGSPVPNVDIDVRPAGGGPKLYTPGDDTNSNGFVDVVVPAGTYDVEFGPLVSTQLVGQVVPNVVVSGGTSLGTVVLLTGWFLSGTVTSAGGAPVAGVDVDVEHPLTGAEVPTPYDDTNAAGFYQVVVPAGTWRVDFDPPAFAPHGPLLVSNVVVAGNTTLNAMLPSSTCQIPTHYGSGTAGTGGVTPSIATDNFARIGDADFEVLLRDGRGGSPAGLALGAAPTSLPLLGGTLLVSPVPVFILRFLLLTGPVGAPCVGAGSVSFSIPNSPAIVGAPIFLQGAVFDPAAPQGFAFTDGLQVTLCS